jgi:hypothetical protein
MAEQFNMKEWVTVNLNGDLLIGDSTYAREWVIDVDTHGYTYQYVKIITLNAEGNDPEEIQIEPNQLLRVCMKGYKIKLNGLGTMKYAFPWVLYDVK